MARASLLPGFRFHPTDVELVMYYLKRKVIGKRLHFQAIAEVNIYKFSPWDLPDKSCLKSKDLEWFFFCPREKKYASGVRVKRATENGYWKTTGKDRPIKYNDRTVGTVKTLVFHLGHPPQGERTDWVLHEYRIADDQLATEGLQDTYVLCKVFKKNGPGPKNGAQYGAPFNEADWADDDIDDANPAVSVDPPPTAMVLPERQSCHTMEGSFDPGSTSVLSFTEGGQCPSAAPSTSKAPLDESDDEIARLLASFTDDELLLPNQNGNHLVDFNGKEKIEYLPNYAECDIYNGFVDQDYWAQMNEGGLDLSGTWLNGCPNNMFSQDNSAYIELNDLRTPLSWPGGVTVTDKSSLGAAVESSYHQNTELSGSSFCIKDHQAVGAESYSHQNHQASSANPLPQLAEGSDLWGNCLDVLHMVQNPFNVGLDDAYELDLDFAHGHPQNGANFSQDMERGRCDDNYGFGK